MARLWDLQSGGAPREFAVKTSVALSPDGRLLALPSADGVSLHDPATGELLRTLQPDNPVTGALAFWRGRQMALAFSRDGSLVAVVGRDGMIRLWSTDSGRQLCTMPGHGGVYALVFTPDERGLLSAGDDGTVRLWEIATGSERHRWKDNHGPAYDLAVSPDGGTLAWAGKEGVVLRRDLSPRFRAAGVTLHPDSLEQIWADLASRDAVKADRSVLALIAAPDVGLPLLKERLKPAARPDARRLRQLIEELDARRFAARERATGELRRLGALVEPALRQTLEVRPPLEVRRRVEQLLEEIDEGRLPAEELRALRAIEALEHADTPEVRKLLQRISTGTPGSPRTKAAAAALRRVD